MTTVNIHAAKTHLSRLVDAAAKGEEVVIARASKPVARLVPFEAAKKPDRVLGTMAGQFTIPDDFDAPRQTQALIQSGANEIMFSAASIWVVAIKARLGRDDFTARPEAVARNARDVGVVEVPIHADAATRVADLPFHHQNPFLDCMGVECARTLGDSRFDPLPLLGPGHASELNTARRITPLTHPARAEKVSPTKPAAGTTGAARGKRPCSASLPPHCLRPSSQPPCPAPPAPTRSYASPT